MASIGSCKLPPGVQGPTLPREDKPAEGESAAEVCSEPKSAGLQPYDVGVAPPPVADSKSPFGTYFNGSYTAEQQAKAVTLKGGQDLATKPGAWGVGLSTGKTQVVWGASAPGEIPETKQGWKKVKVNSSLGLVDESQLGRVKLRTQGLVNEKGVSAEAMASYGTPGGVTVSAAAKLKGREGDRGVGSLLSTPPIESVSVGVEKEGFKLEGTTGLGAASVGPQPFNVRLSYTIDTQRSNLPGNLRGVLPGNLGGFFELGGALNEQTSANARAMAITQGAFGLSASGGASKLPVAPNPSRSAVTEYADLEDALTHARELLGPSAHQLIAPLQSVAKRTDEAGRHDADRYKQELIVALRAATEPTAKETRNYEAMVSKHYLALYFYDSMEKKPPELAVSMDLFRRARAARRLAETGAAAE